MYSDRNQRQNWAGPSRVVNAEEAAGELIDVDPIEVIERGDDNDVNAESTASLPQNPLQAPTFSQNAQRNVDNADVDEVELDREIARLGKRRRIMELRRQLAEEEIEGELIPRAHVPRYTFDHINGTIAKFSGDDGYGVLKWVSDFETVMAPLHCDDIFRLLCARRLLTGTAEIWLRQITANTWPIPLPTYYMRWLALNTIRNWVSTTILYE